MPTEIETLTKKIKAYEQVVKIQKNVISNVISRYREQEKKWREAVNTLESEREMNQRLTEEIAQITKRTIEYCINTLEFHGFDDAVPYIKWMATNKLGIE